MSSLPPSWPFRVLRLLYAQRLRWQVFVNHFHVLWECDDIWYRMSAERNISLLPTDCPWAEPKVVMFECISDDFYLERFCAPSRCLPYTTGHHASWPNECIPEQTELYQYVLLSRYLDTVPSWNEAKKKMKPQCPTHIFSYYGAVTMNTCWPGAATDVGLFTCTQVYHLACVLIHIVLSCSDACSIHVVMFALWLLCCYCVSVVFAQFLHATSDWGSCERRHRPMRKAIAQRAHSKGNNRSKGKSLIEGQ